MAPGYLSYAGEDEEEGQGFVPPDEMPEDGGEGAYAAPPTGSSYGYQMPRAGEQPDRPEPTLRQMAGIPPLKMVNGKAMITDEEGNPLASLSEFHDRLMAAQPQQPRGYAGGYHGFSSPAAMGSSMARAGGLAADPQWQRQKAEFEAYYNPGQAALQAGLPPNYGLAGGPELPAQTRQKIAEAEAAIQAVRDDPKYSTEQKLQVVTAMSKKLATLDPLSRYRNGQQPMSAVDKFKAQNLHVDEDNGYVMALDAKGNPHFHSLPKEKAAKEESESFDEMPLKDQHKITLDYAKEFGIPYKQAHDEVRSQMGLHAKHGQAPAQGTAQGHGAHMQVVGEGGATQDLWAEQGADPRAAQDAAMGKVQRFLGGERMDPEEARQAYQNMHPDARWQVDEAAGDVDHQMQHLEQRRQAAVAGGAPFSMPDRATLEARQQRARQLQMPMAQGMGDGGQNKGLHQPLMTRDQRVQAAKDQAAAAKEAETRRVEARKDAETQRKENAKADLEAQEWYTKQHRALYDEAVKRVGLPPHVTEGATPGSKVHTPNPAALDIGDVDRVVKTQKEEMGLAPDLKTHMRQHYEAHGREVPQRWQEAPPPAQPSGPLKEDWSGYRPIQPARQSPLIMGAPPVSEAQAKLAARVGAVTSQAVEAKDHRALWSKDQVLFGLRDHPEGPMGMGPEDRRKFLWHLEQLRKYDPSLPAVNWQGFGVKRPKEVGPTGEIVEE